MTDPRQLAETICGPIVGNHQFWKESAETLARELLSALDRADEADRWRDSWHDEARAAISTAISYEEERNAAEARAAAYEQALRKIADETRPDGFEGGLTRTVHYIAREALAAAEETKP